MRTPPTKLATILGSTLLLAGLSACSADPEPIIDPSPPTTSPPASPTPTATLTPPEQEQESAKAFIRRWQSASFEMQNSGDTAAYLALTEDCSSCQALASGVEAIYGGGGSVDQAGGSVSAVNRVGKVDSVLIYEFVLETNASSILGEDGEVETRLSGGKARYQVNILKESGSWLVQRVSRVSS